MNPFDDRYVRVGNINTRYWQAGAAGTAVILLHGIACSVLEWQKNIEALAARHQVYAIDLVGSGLSDKPRDEDYSLRRLAQFVLEFMITQKIDRAHLVGNSLGGRLAIECALIAPERLLSIALIAPAGVGRKAMINFRLASLPVLGELLTTANRAGLKMLWRLAFYDQSLVTPEFVETKYQLAKQPGAQAAFLKTLRGFVGFRGFPAKQVTDLQTAMQTINTPTQVIWGRQDKALPFDQASIVSRYIPKVKAQVFNHCGHMPQFELPERVNPLLLGFWSDVEAAKDS